MIKFQIKVLIAIIWLTFTVSLAGWWFLHAWNQIELSADNGVRTMLKWEGFSLLLSLLAGGIAIVYLIYQERKSYRTLNDFYLAFSHDLKNSMTSLQMQIGALRDEYRGEQSPILVRLERDSRRLKMKLENSLELSKLEIAPLYLENIFLSDILARVRFSEPDIEISLNHDQQIYGDRRAIEIIFLNLIDNAIKHGKATRIIIEANVFNNNKILVRFSDNGSGYEGSRKKLVEMFHSSNSDNSSGIGLYLVDKLIAKMKGKIAFPAQKKQEGFAVLLTFFKAKNS
ncbi:MAG: HAMP domain-containing histidine kinase [Devosiaceae bacterium]|nr:HAMP domain-containing histidine kinase [Devosiaceae bacterium]